VSSLPSPLSPITPSLVLISHFLDLIQLSSVSVHVLIVLILISLPFCPIDSGKAASSRGTPVEVIDLLSSSDEEGDTDKSKTVANGKGKAKEDASKAAANGKGKAKEDGTSGGAKDDKGKGRLKPLPTTSTSTATSTSTSMAPSTSTSTASGMRAMERWVHVDGVRGLVDRPGEVEGLRRGPGGKKGGTRRLHYVMAVDATQRVTDVTR
jgi:hypothetical protein